MSDPEPSAHKDPESHRAQRTGLARILKNTASAQVTRVLDAVVFLGLIPFIVDQLGIEQYGIWGVIWAIVSLFALVDLGFSSAVVKFVADALGKQDADQFRRVVSTLFWVFVAQGVFLLLVTLGLHTFFDTLFEVPKESVGVAQVAFSIVAAAAVLKLPLATFRGVLVGTQQSWLVHLYHATATILYASGVLWILPRWPDLRTLALLNVVLSLLPAVLMALYCAFRVPGVSIRPRDFDKQQLSSCWNFSSAFMLIQVATLVGSRVDIFILQAALPVASVALYVVAMRVSTQAMAFCSQLTGVLSPVVAELHGAGDEQRLKKLWLDGSRFSVAFATPLLFGCAVLAQPLLRTWVGSEFDGAVIPLQLLLAATFVALIHGNSHIQLSMRGDQTFLSRVMILGQILNLVASLIVVHFWGLNGVAAATLLAPLLADVVFVQRRLCKKLNTGMLRYYAAAVLPSLVPTVVMVGFLLLSQSLYTVTHLLEVAALETIAIALFWGLFWRLGLSADERRGLYKRVRRRLART